MDILNHSISSFTISHFSGLPLEVSIPCAVVATMPDLIGVLGGSHKGEWGWYNWAHKPNILWALPPYLLHILMDYPAHIEDKKYWWHCNIASWIGLIIFWSIKCL